MPELYSSLLFYHVPGSIDLTLSSRADKKAAFPEIFAGIRTELPSLAGLVQPCIFDLGDDPRLSSMRLKRCRISGLFLFTIIPGVIR